MSDLPNGWFAAPLSELSEPAPSWNPKTHDGEFDYIDIDAIDNKRQLVEQPKRLSASEAPSRARVRVGAGDVLFSLVRPYLKNIAVVPETSRVAVASTAFCRVRPPEGVDPRYVFNFLRQDALINALPTYGSSPPAARDEEFFAISVPVAPSLEQERIVSKLDELFSDLDAGVASLQRAQANLKRYRAAVLKSAVEGRLTAEWRKSNSATETGAELLARLLRERRERWEDAQLAKFEASGKPPPNGWRSKYVEPAAPDVSDLPPLPHGWCWASIDHIADVTSGNTPADIESFVEVDGEVVWFKVGDMNLPGNEEWMRVGGKRLSSESVSTLALKLIPSGSIVFPKRGGAIATNKKRKLEFPAACDLNLMAVTPAAGMGDFLWIFFQQLRLERLSDGSNVPQINHHDIKPLPVPLPPIAEQREIAKAIEVQFSQLVHVERSLVKTWRFAALLRQSVLKHAFAGKLVPQDAGDEPASVLLERIRAERIAGNAAPRGRQKSIGMSKPQARSARKTVKR